MSETAADPLVPFAVPPETDAELAADLRAFYEEHGAIRSRSTAAQWRRALAQFATSAGSRKLADLPASFVADEWFGANCPPDMNPVQKSIQLSCIKQFAEWARAKGRAAPAFTYPIIPRPPRRPVAIEVAEPSDPATPQEPAVPSDTTPVVPIRAAAGGKIAAARSPLKALMPSGFKLRVWRKAPDGVSEIYVGDFVSELVRRHGGAEPFLKNYVLKREPVVGVQEIVYLVAEANPSGELTSDIVEFAVSNSAAQDLEPAEDPPVPPPMPPASATPTVIVQPTAPAPAIPPPPNTAGMTPEQMFQALDAYRNSIDRLRAELQQQRVTAPTPAAAAPAPPLPAPSREVDDLRHEIADTRRQLDGLAVKLDAVLERVAQPPLPTPTGQKSGMAETIEALPRLREAFTPEVVDTSAMEQQLIQLRAEIASALKAISEGSAKDRRGGLREMAEDLKFVRETLGGGGGFFGGAESRGPVDLVANIVDKLIGNADRLADAWDKVVQSTARAKMGMVNPPPPALPPSGSAASPPPAQTKAQQIGLPKDVQDAMEALLAAEGDEPIYSAILTLLGALNAHTETQPIVAKVQEIAATGADGAFQSFLHTVFTQLGYGEKATPLKLQTIIEGFYRVHAELEARKQKRAEAQAAQRREERQAAPEAPAAEPPAAGDDPEDAEVIAAEVGDDGTGDDAEEPEGEGGKEDGDPAEQPPAPQETANAG